jgi:hypothetical protein
MRQPMSKVMAVATAVATDVGMSNVEEGQLSCPSYGSGGGTSATSVRLWSP